jgi:hypothetical protein
MLRQFEKLKKEGKLPEGVPETPPKIIPAV